MSTTTMTNSPEVPPVYEAFARRYQSDPADPVCADELRHYSAGWTDAAAVSAADNAALRKRVEELEAASQWRPIETAPKDGTWIMITRECADEAYVAKWAEYPGNPVAGADGAEDVCMWGWLLRDPWAYPGGMEDGFLGWEEDADHMPTHWMPLPSQPKEPT